METLESRKTVIDHALDMVSTAKAHITDVVMKTTGSQAGSRENSLKANSPLKEGLNTESNSDSRQKS